MSAQANFYPERIYKERTKFKLNSGWKFSQDDPNNPISGDPSTVAFSDASWKTVNIPHSASYDAPTQLNENASFQGTSWYRLKFTTPVSAKHSGKLFLQFDGAMQAADVWLNGQKLGTHDNSGYTGFSFDITGKTVSGNNVLAVKLDNTYSVAIPPGCPGAAGYGPDYYLFSGLYRNVWLVCTDVCNIPLYGQQISVAKGPYTNGAPVRIKTTVRNENSTAKSVMLRYVFAYDENQANRGFLIDSLTQTVAANQSLLFDKTDTIPNSLLTLWSLDNPYLYRVFTQVFVDGVLMDDNVERFGVRWFTWNGAENFKLNGLSVYLKGNSVHQMFPWIQNAASPSRYFKDLQLVKDMGMNLVRCAHYPRDPSFYNACDELGLLCFVEIPTWGNGKPDNYYGTGFWDRENACVKEMIDVGYNHPSIIGWGLFNEPGGDFITRIDTLNTIAHRLDSTRFTYMANNNKTFNIMSIPDIAGLNYFLSNDPGITVSLKPTRTMSTEYHIGWTGDYAFRGDPNDRSDYNAAHFWTDWAAIVGVPAMAGGVMWCHADYNSIINYLPMGAVDNYRIPKSVFYLFRKNWRNIPDDNPVVGLTASTIKLETDTNTLVADSVDCAFIYASIRDATGKCVHTGYEATSSTTMTYAISSGANLINYFGPLTVKVDGGKCALMVKSKNQAGTVTVTATTNTGLTSNPVTITLVPDSFNANDPAYYFITPILSRALTPVNKNVAIKQFKHTLQIVFPSKDAVVKDVSLLNSKGQRTSCPFMVNGKTLVFDIRGMATGFYYLSIAKKQDYAVSLKKLLITN
jgi:hypothetical protein